MQINSSLLFVVVVVVVVVKVVAVVVIVVEYLSLGSRIMKPRGPSYMIPKHCFSV
jgi:hypothetical protein